MYLVGIFRRALFGVYQVAPAASVRAPYPLSLPLVHVTPRRASAEIAVEYPRTGRPLLASRWELSTPDADFAARPGGLRLHWSVVDPADRSASGQSCHDG